MRRILSNITFAALISVSGCATGPQYTGAAIPTGKAVIYIYRVAQFQNSAISPTIVLNDRRVGELTNGGYFALAVPPGQHRISFEQPKGRYGNTTEVTLDGSEVRYVRLSTTYLQRGLFNVRTFSVSVVEEAEASPQIAETRKIEAATE